jgi:hypothetical protein
MGLCRAADPSARRGGGKRRTDAGGDERRDVHPEHRLQCVPLDTGAVPQWAPVGTQKAGTSTDDGLKATIFVADDLSSVIVLRTKNQDCFAIDSSTQVFIAVLSHAGDCTFDYALRALASRSTVQ